MNFIFGSGKRLKRRKVPALINQLFWTTSVNLDEGDKNLLLSRQSSPAYVFLEFFLILYNNYSETHKIVDTRNRNKPIRSKITKPQTATVISLWFEGLLHILNFIVIQHS